MKILDRRIVLNLLRKLIFTKYRLYLYSAHFLNTPQVVFKEIKLPAEPRTCSTITKIEVPLRNSLLTAFPEFVHKASQLLYPGDTDALIDLFINQ